jgi:hypothetical protein
VSAYAADGNFESAIRAMESAGDSLLMTAFGELEAVHALELRAFRKEMNREQVDLCVDNFGRDVKAGVFDLLAVPESAFRRAREVSRKTTAQFGTRTSDLLHVACALELGAIGFDSFDKQQRRLAKSMNLTLND